MGFVIGVVPYLNAEPLVAALREPPLADEVQVCSEVPSLLANQLLAGELDAALVSIGAVLPEPSLRLLPGYCIASHERVRSIQLYHLKPLDQARIVALDASSRSAEAQARVLFAERYGVHPQYVVRPPDLRAMLAEADCALLIGNPALQANALLDSGGWDGPPVSRIDLGAEWFAETGLPFVYAAWAIPADRDPAPLHALLARAAEWGLPRAEALARAGAESAGVPLEVALDYLTRVIHYRLGEREIAGMERFLVLAQRHGVMAPDAAIRWALLPAGSASDD